MSKDFDPVTGGLRSEARRLEASSNKQLDRVDVSRIELPDDWTVIRLTVGTSALQLTATSVPCRSMPIIKAHPSNTDVVYVYKAGVTTATGIPLGKGESIPLPVKNLNEIYVIAGAASQDVCAVAGKDAA
jgi:hypothetical protein